MKRNPDSMQKEKMKETGSLPGAGGRAEFAEAKRKRDASSNGILASEPMNFMPELHREERALNSSNTAEASKHVSEHWKSIWDRWPEKLTALATDRRRAQHLTEVSKRTAVESGYGSV